MTDTRRTNERARPWQAILNEYGPPEAAKELGTFISESDRLNGSPYTPDKPLNPLCFREEKIRNEQLKLLQQRVLSGELEVLWRDRSKSPKIGYQIIDPLVFIETKISGWGDLYSEDGASFDGLIVRPVQPAPVAAGKPPAGGKGGRPVKVRWADAAARMVAWITENGESLDEYGKQAEAEGFVNDGFPDGGGPAESEIRAFVKLTCDAVAAMKRAQRKG